MHLPIIHFLGFAFGGVVNGRKYLLTIDFRLSTVNKYLSMLKQCLRFGQLCWKRPMQSKLIGLINPIFLQKSSIRIDYLDHGIHQPVMKLKFLNFNQSDYF